MLHQLRAARAGPQCVGRVLLHELVSVGAPGAMANPTEVRYGWSGFPACDGVAQTSSFAANLALAIAIGTFGAVLSLFALTEIVQSYRQFGYKTTAMVSQVFALCGLLCMTLFQFVQIADFYSPVGAVRHNGSSLEKSSRYSLQTTLLYIFGSLGLILALAHVASAFIAVATSAEKLQHVHGRQYTFMVFAYEAVATIVLLANVFAGQYSYATIFALPLTAVIAIAHVISASKFKRLVRSNLSSSVNYLLLEIVQTSLAIAAVLALYCVLDLVELALTFAVGWRATPYGTPVPVVVIPNFMFASMMSAGHLVVLYFRRIRVRKLLNLKKSETPSNAKSPTASSTGGRSGGPGSAIMSNSVQPVATVADSEQ